jgi:hypothetical protein
VREKIAKRGIDLIALALLFCGMFFLAYCQAAEYEEIQTSEGKVITGIDKDEAFKKYGMPESARGDLWYYSSPESLFVYFSAQEERVYLYPRSGSSSVGELTEFKVFAGTPESGISDVTSEARILLSNPKAFKFIKKNVIIPKESGEYQVFASYKGIFSNPSYLTSKPADPKKKIIINVLPYKPNIPIGSRIEFTALGLILETGGYAVEDISAKAKWFIRQGENVAACRDNTLYFPSAGTFDVFCEYEGSRSAVQEAFVKEIHRPAPHVLKNILLLPELIKLKLGKTIFLKAFGTYYDNKVEDITGNVRWILSDRKVGDIWGNGIFYARKPGSAEIVADFNSRLSSLPLKIIVLDQEYPDLDIAPDPDKRHPAKNEDKKKEKDEDQDMPEQDDANSPDQRNKNDRGRVDSGLSKGLVKIKVSPEGLKIPLGGEGSLKAAGVYSDGREKDLTPFVLWVTRDKSIAVVAKGKLAGLSEGKTNVRAKMKEVESEPVLITVTGPDLLSIIVTPQKARLTYLDRLQLKAKGYYSDSSFKDITSQAVWRITGPRIMRIDKARIIPSGFGKTEVRAEYAGVKSLPVSIEIIFTWAWFWKAFCIMLGYLSLASVLLFFVFYLMIKYKAGKIRELKDDPREFIFAAYHNLKKVMDIFAFKARSGQTPLVFAGSAEEIFAIKDRAFLSLTEKFEEARYSSNPLSPEDVELAGTCYEKALNDILANYGKVYLLRKYIRALAERVPFSLKTAKC